MRVLLFILSFFTFFQQGVSQMRYDSVDFVPPLDIPLILAGNFAELRSNHFHTGIDIKTYGQEGYAVTSIEDGYVSRIKISHYGYGKVLYVTHPNGFTSVYAHLQKFNADVEKYAREYQYAHQTETFDVYPDSTDLPVNKGETIALSGNTGSSTAPHLHFEIRETKSERALNPLLFKFKVNDNVKPILNGVKLYALEDGYINGKAEDIKIPTRGGDGSYTLKYGTFDVDGEIGLAIHAIDKLNDAPNKCGVFNIKLFVDDSLHFEQSLPSMDFAYNRYINAYKDYEEYHKNNFHYHRSFLLPNNPLDVYDSVRNQGKLRFTDSALHQIRYEVYDVYGNKSVVSFGLKHNPTMVKEPKPTANENAYTLKYNTADTIRYEDMVLAYENATFYENIKLPISTSDHSGLQSKLYSVNGNYVPVQKYFALMINARGVSERHREKAIIAKLNGGNSFRSLGGQFEDGYIKADVRELGDFGILIDSIAPEVRPLNVHIGKAVSFSEDILFHVFDDLSGIETYNAYLNDKWVLANYSPQKSKLTIASEALKRFQAGNYTLKVEVADERNNLTTKEFSISLK